MEEWKILPEFPGYSVSSLGRVRHERMSRELTVFANKSGGTYVGFTVGDKTCNRSVGLLVANHFLKEPPHESFNSVINLNGNRFDNRAKNLAWRPYWFTRRYFHQFKFPPKGFKIPVMELSTGQIFPNSWEAAIRFGLLDADILVQTMNGESVWPTRHRFTPAR